MYNKGQRRCHNLLCYPVCNCSNVGIWKSKPFSKPIPEVKHESYNNQHYDTFKKNLLNFVPSSPSYYPAFVDFHIKK